MIDGNPTFSQVESIGSSGIDYTATDTQGNYYVGIEEVPVYGKDGFQNNTADESSWWSRNSDWLLPVIGGIGSVATGGWLPALIGAAAGIYSNYQQNEYNKEQYERERQDALAAENRANEEYDRRQKAAQEYNDAWDQRLLAKGYSPYAALNKGQGVTSTSPSAPSPIQMPHGIPRQSAMNSIGTASQIAQQIASARQTAAQTRLTNAQADIVEKESIGFWQKFQNEMDAVLANTKDTRVATAIKESEFRVRVATEMHDIQQASYETSRLYFEMKAAAYAPEFANARLADLYMELHITALREEIMANEAAISGNELQMSNLSLEEMRLMFEARKENDVYARDILARINHMELTNQRIRQERDWYGFNQILGFLSSSSNSAGKFTTETTTTNEGHDVFGNRQTRKQTTRKIRIK